MKTLSEYFRDWEADTFGFGYGTGETFVLLALKTFFAAIGREDSSRSYDYEKLEQAVTPIVAWLLINALCRKGIIDYGTSPRYGWLSTGGEELQTFIKECTTEELYDICTNHDENYIHCGKNYCNCDPDVSDNHKCANPFWK